MNDEDEFIFRPAVRSNVGLFIGLAGEEGSGKTYSAMMLASGIVGPNGRFAVIDTENKRSLHYADDFAFDVFHLTAPFTSERYEAASLAAVKTGARAIVLDSASHEHDGIGGYLDRQEEELEQRVERYMKKYPDAKEYDVREKFTPISWQPGKKARKRMRQTLLACSTSIPIIWCFRAEEKVFGSKDGKMVTFNPPRWAPICGKGMPFEMTAFFLMHQDRPGVPIPLKLQDQHKALFPTDRKLDRESGRAIAAWAAGSGKAPTTASNTSTGAQEYITADEAATLETLCFDAKVNPKDLCAAAKIETLRKMPKRFHKRALEWINEQLPEEST